MHIVHHAHLPHLQLPGETCICAADATRGIAGFEVWVRTLEPGAHTAALQHDAQLAVVALAGSGKLLIDGGPQRFHGPCTLVIPPGAPFELANAGSLPLELIWVFTSAPTPVRADNG